MSHRASDYFSKVSTLLAAIEVSDPSGAELGLDAGVDAAIARLLRAADRGGKVILVGNGGSASIAGHMEMDLCNRVGVRAIVFNDPPVLTALANDHGFESAFERMVQRWAAAEDCLIAISSSGRSRNIHRAVAAARDAGAAVITFSGFDAGNPLRTMGDFNFYVASHHYGEVEAAHHTLGHFVTDEAAERKQGGR